jgi:hypothetical protein
MHPLLYFTFPRAIHLALPMIYPTLRVLKTSLSLIVKASLRLSLSRHSCSACVATIQHILGRSWLTTGFSCLNNIVFQDFHLDSLHLSSRDIYFLSHLYHRYKVIMIYYHQFQIQNFLATMSPTDFQIPHLFLDLFHTKTRFTSMRLSFP